MNNSLQGSSQWTRSSRDTTASPPSGCRHTSPHREGARGALSTATRRHETRRRRRCTVDGSLLCSSRGRPRPPCPAGDLPALAPASRRRGLAAIFRLRNEEREARRVQCSACRAAILGASLPTSLCVRARTKRSRALGLVASSCFETRRRRSRQTSNAHAARARFGGREDGNMRDTRRRFAPVPRTITAGRRSVAAATEHRAPRCAARPPRARVARPPPFPAASGVPSCRSMPAVSRQRQICLYLARFPGALHSPVSAVASSRAWMLLTTSTFPLDWPVVARALVRMRA